MEPRDQGTVRGIVGNPPEVLRISYKHLHCLPHEQHITLNCETQTDGMYLSYHSLGNIIIDSGHSLKSEVEGSHGVRMKTPILPIGNNAQAE